MIRAVVALVLLLLVGCSHGPTQSTSQPGTATAAPGTTPTVPPKNHLVLRREADQAFQRKDYPAAIAATQAALVLRPDSPRYLYNLACAYALTHRPNEALETLRRLAALGVVVELEKDPDLASVRALPGFKQIRVAIHKNGLPHGKVAPMFDVPNRTGIIEGIAYRAATEDYFLGDVHNRCVWRSQHDGTLTQFSAKDANLLGVFKLAVDEPHGLLWLSTSALPEVEGYTAELKGKGALAALDLKTGKVARNYPLPDDGRDHCLGDFLLAPDGTVYVTDSTAPIIWRLPRGGDHLEKFLEYAGFSSLQGVGLLAHDTKLVVTDYANGIFVIDLATRAVTAVTPPARATLLGIDALIVKGDAILGVQNGVEPQRVIRVQLTPTLDRATRFDVLASAYPNFDDLTHFVLVDGWLMLVTKSGWTEFETNKVNPPAHMAHVVTINAP